MISMISVKIRDSDLFLTLQDKSGVLNKTKKAHKFETEGV